MITCKELAEILLKTPDHRVTVSVDDGYGMQCDVDVDRVEELKNSDTISIITELPDIYD